MNEYEVVIIGAGMAGLLMGIKLQEAGISFTILEKSNEVGGTWRDNRFPGLYCDIPARFYSYSFAPNPNWSCWYAPGNEIQQYFRDVTDKYGLRRHIRFGQKVRRAEFRDGHWHVATETDEHVRGRVLVTAMGFLHHPSMPDIAGVGDFAGKAFHSAQWDPDAQLEGKRVGIIGNGSTGVQMTCELPAIAEKVTLFQRTPQWVLPLPNKRYSRMTRWAMRRSERLNRMAYRGWQGFLETIFVGLVEPGWRRKFVAKVCALNLRSVKDPELRQMLTPKYEAGCKRLVMSGRFYKAVQQPNVKVVVERIQRVEPEGVRTMDGALHPLDVLVFATGYHTRAYMRPMEIVAQDGTTLEDVWRDRVSSFRTVALPPFRNFFMLGGPFSPVNIQSVFHIAETQVSYVMQLLRLLREDGVVSLVPTEKATNEFMRDVDAAMPKTIYATGCQSWYFDRDGSLTLWPWLPKRHREMLRAPAMEEFDLTYQ